MGSADKIPVVDSFPEHSNSDLMDKGWNENEEEEVSFWVRVRLLTQTIEQSPFLMAVLVSTLVFVLLICIGCCVVCSICRTNWALLFNNFWIPATNNKEVKAQARQPRVKGADYYTVTARTAAPPSNSTMRQNSGWVYQNATIFPSHSIPRANLYDLPTRRPSNVQASSRPSSNLSVQTRSTFPEEELVEASAAVQNFGPEDEEEDHSSSNNSTTRREYRVSKSSQHVPKRTSSTSIRTVPAYASRPQSVAADYYRRSSAEQPYGKHVANRKGLCTGKGSSGSLNDCHDMVVYSNPNGIWDGVDDVQSMSSFGARR